MCFQIVKILCNILVIYAEYFITHLLPMHINVKQVKMSKLEPQLPCRARWSCLVPVWIRCLCKPSLPSPKNKILQMECLLDFTVHCYCCWNLLFRWTFQADPSIRPSCTLECCKHPENFQIHIPIYKQTSAEGKTCEWHYLHLYERVVFLPECHFHHLSPLGADVSKTRKADGKNRTEDRGNDFNVSKLI